MKPFKYLSMVILSLIWSQASFAQVELNEKIVTQVCGDPDLKGKVILLQSLGEKHNLKVPDKKKNEVAFVGRCNESGIFAVTNASKEPLHLNGEFKTPLNVFSASSDVVLNGATFQKPISIQADSIIVQGNVFFKDNVFLFTQNKVEIG